MQRYEFDFRFQISDFIFLRIDSFFTIFAIESCKGDFFSPLTKNLKFLQL